MAGMLVAYHGAGASFLREVPKYATANAVEYAEKGGGRALIDQFAAATEQSWEVRTILWYRHLAVTVLTARPPVG